MWSEASSVNDLGFPSRITRNEKPRAFKRFNSIFDFEDWITNGSRSLTLELVRATFLNYYALRNRERANDSRFLSL